MPALGILNNRVGMNKGQNADELLAAVSQQCHTCLGTRQPRPLPTAEANMLSIYDYSTHSSSVLSSDDK